MHPGLFPFVLGYPEHAEPGLGQGRQRLVVASGLPGARDPPQLESNDGVARSGADVAAYFPPTRVARAVGLSRQPARVTATWPRMTAEDAKAAIRTAAGL